MTSNFYLNTIQLVLFVFAILYVPAHTYSQTVEISLTEAKLKIKTNNKKLKISKQDYEIAKAKYEQSRSVILPNINISNTSSFTNNPLNAFGFKLLQQSVTVPDFNPNSLNQPGQVENFNTRIGLIQPIINVDGWKERKASNLQLKASDLQYKREADYIELEVTKTFMQLQLAYKMVLVTEKAMKTSIENQKIAKNNLLQGLIQNADLLNFDIRVTELKNQLQYSKSNVKNISDYLAFLIGEENLVTYRPNTELSILTSDFNKQSQLSIERSDIQAIKLNVDAQEQILKSSKMSFVPRANAFANYEWNDKDVFGFESSNYLFGLQLSWDVFGGYKNIGKVHEEKAQLEKANLHKDNYIAQSQLELGKVRRQIIDAENNIKLSKLALDQSQEILRIKTNRFEQGLEKTIDLLLVETQFRNKELDYCQAIYNYNYTLSYLKFLTN